MAGLGMLGLAVWVHRRHEAPALRPFVLLVAVVGTLAFVDGLAAGNITTLSVVWVTAVMTIPLAFTWFVVEYYGLSYLASPVRKAAFVAPAVVGVVGGVALILSPIASGSMAGAPSAPAVPAPLGFAALAEQVGIYYAGGTMLVGVGLLVSTARNYEHIDGRLGAVFSFVVAWPWLAYAVTPGIVTQVPVQGVVGMTAGGYVLSAAAVGFTVTRGGLFEAAPAAGTLGPETVLAELDDAVVVVDRDQRVVQMNGAALDTFGVEADAVSSELLEDCLGADLETLRTRETVELTVRDGTRQFEATVSPVRDRFDRQPGHAIVITDVTRERVRSQRLAVLNRVLRHNLRNRMTSIIGRAEIIADSDHKHADSAETILTSADELVTFSERAREIEEMMSVDPRVEGDVTLAPLVEEVLEPYREEYPDASLSVDIDDSLSVSVDRRILSSVLDNLVENALAHNDAPTRVVTVSARAADDGTGTRLSVADNGPGIPEHERAVIETGDESPLDHGSGLGLWTVKWGLVRLGGEVEFGDNNPRGTVVTVSLPSVADPVTAEPIAAEA